MGWHETWVDYFRFPYLAIWWQSRNYFVWWIAFSLSMSESVNDLHLDMFNQSFWGISHVGPTNDAITMMSAKWRVLSLYSTIMNEIMRQNVCQHLRRGIFGWEGPTLNEWVGGQTIVCCWSGSRYWNCKLSLRHPETGPIISHPLLWVDNGDCFGRPFNRIIGIIQTIVNVVS